MVKSVDIEWREDGDPLPPEKPEGGSEDTSRWDDNDTPPGVPMPRREHDGD